MTDASDHNSSARSDAARSGDEQAERSGSSGQPPSPYRLARTVRPTRYDIEMAPDLDSASFSGSVEIAVTVAEPTDRVTLNAAELEITSAAVTQGDVTHDATVTYDEQAEQATLLLAAGSRLDAGAAVVHCDFDGTLNDKLRGFYRSSYTDEGGTTHTIATTQFESTNARRAFPCFDEPDAKAVFGVTMVVPAGFMAVSCGAEESSELLDDGRRRVVFADTMPMSTYLMAFVAGELEATEPVDVGGVPVRICHIPGKGHLTGFGMQAATFALDWLTSYYGIEYPGEKLDLLAIPDFAFGAMENMAAVTFRETLLLADPSTATTGELLRVVDVIAHELAHMWFGNLVTMDWWNGVWLKEAFATFMQVKTTDAFRPEWRRWDEFCVERGAAFDTDALTHTRPVEFNVVSPAEAEGMYDVITYEKGAAAVRMLEQYLGEEEFRAGVHHYLRKHAYRNVTTTDLWDALEEATGAPVRSVMDSWIFQGGYPVVDVQRAGLSSLRLAQRRFAYAASDADLRSTTTDVAEAGAPDAAQHSPARHSTAQQHWKVPVLMRVGLRNGTTAEHRLLLEDETVLDCTDEVEFAVVNAGGHGYYRVSCAQDLQASVVERALDELAPIERYALVDDLYCAVAAGQAQAAAFVQTVTALGAETDCHVWERMLAGLEGLYAIADPAGRERISALVRDLATTALGIVGHEPVDGETDLDRKLRSTLFQAAGDRGGDEHVRRRAAVLFEQAVSDNGSLEANLAAAVITVTVADGDAAHYDRILALSQQAATPQAEVRFLAALGRFAQRDLFERTLQYYASEVRTQNAPYLLGAAMGHTDWGPLAWAFVRDRWEALCAKFPQNSIARMASGIRALSTRELAAETAAFFAEHPIPQGRLIVAQHLDKQWVNVRLREREGHRLAG